MNDFGEQTGSTADALLRAARKLFAENGFDGTSIRAVTAAAGANLAAVGYHFGSKEGLYAAVLDAALAPFVERVSGAAHGAGTPLERVAGVVREYFQHLDENPDMLRLLQQVLSAGGGATAQAVAAVRQVHGAISAMIREGQADGSIREGNPYLMAVSVVSHPLHINLMRRPLKAIAGIDLDDPVVKEQAMDNAVRFACAGLAAHHGEG